MKGKNAKKKEAAYGDSVRIKSKTVALIDRLEPEDMPFNTKLWRVVTELAKIKGVVIKE